VNCPRCFGLMLAESDIHGEFVTCITCGYVSYGEPVDYTPATRQGLRKVERLKGRSKVTREGRR